MAKSNFVMSHIVMAAVGCLLPMFASAQSSMEDIGQVREKLARLEAQVELMQKEFQVEQYKVHQDTWRKQNEQAATGLLPTVTAIFNHDNKWQTRLTFETGVTRLLAVGDVVSPGVRVADIAQTGVTISRVIPDKDRSVRRGRKIEEEIQLILLKPTPTTAAALQQQIQPPVLGSTLPNPAPMGR